MQGAGVRVRAPVAAARAALVERFPGPGLGVGVWGLGGFTVCGLGSRVECLGFRV